MYLENEEASQQSCDHDKDSAGEQHKQAVFLDFGNSGSP